MTLDTYALRFADGSDDTLEGWLIPFGGNFNGRDSYGTFATRATDFMLDLFPSWPLMYDHGQDADLGPTVIGRITSLEPRDEGIWMRATLGVSDVAAWTKAQLAKHNSYINEIRQMIANGAVGLSSGAVAHLVEIDEKTGEWIRWPVAEGSITPRPSNLLATIPVAAYASACRSAGIDLTDEALETVGDEVASEGAMRAKLSSKERDSLSDADFAYIDADGDRHLPINDAAHVKAALARLDQTEFESDAKKAAAKKKILAAAKEFGVEVADDDNAARSTRAAAVSTVETSFEDIRDDICDLLNAPRMFSDAPYSHVVATYADHVIVCRHDGDPNEYGCTGCDDGSYWSVSYTLDDTGEPVLGDEQQVEAAFIPVSTRSSTNAGPLSLDAQRITRAAIALGERTQDLTDRRIREGRALSAANRQLIADTHEAMGKAHVALGELLDRTNREIEDAARAANPETWLGLAAEMELLSFTI